MGAGLAGLTAGQRLQDLGWKVILIDKGRVPGGRMSTRHFAGAVFDHGAQFFTVRDPRFHATVEQWEAEGIAQPWFTNEGHTRYRGSTGMNSIPAHLAKSLDVRVSEHVERVSPAWKITTRTGTYQADALVLTAPIEQSLQMLECELPPAIQQKLASVRFSPCFAALALLSAPSRLPKPGYVKPEQGPISWIADNQLKGISPLPAITIHASPEFTQTYWDAPRDQVGDLLVAEAGNWLGDGTQVIERQVHRWKYSMPVETLQEPYLAINAPGPLVFAGDAFAGPRVEGAYLSGWSAAEALNAL